MAATEFKGGSNLVGSVRHNRGNPEGGGALDRSSGPPTSPPRCDRAAPLASLDTHKFGGILQGIVCSSVVLCVCGLCVWRRGSRTRGLHSQTGGRGAKGRSGCRAFSEKIPICLVQTVCVCVCVCVVVHTVVGGVVVLINAFC